MEGVIRSLADARRITAFLEALGREVKVPTRFYLVGGASAVLKGWRPMTADIDFAVEPESTPFWTAVARLKDTLDVSVEPAAPSHFIPEIPGWRERSPWIGAYGRLQAHHYDFTSQALAKIERGHRQDEADVRSMLAHGLVDPDGLRAAFARIEPDMIRYPAVDPRSFGERVRAALREEGP